VFNGFRPDQDLGPWRQALERVEHEELLLADPVLDLVAYGQAVERIPAASYCFLNSYSVIRHDGWLELMRSIASGPRVGAVGATGSWASQSSHIRYELGLGGPYRRVFASREATHRVFAALDPHTPKVPAPSSRLELVRRTVRSLLTYTVAFPTFPAPHLRSNCMLIGREVWSRALGKAPTEKLAAYRVESGRKGITARLKAMGLLVLVAGHDGRAYEPADWPASQTFWQGEQRNLLVEDNQTRAYDEGDAEVRSVLSGYAWGLRAEPSLLASGLS
jgi:hypothetical protein